MAVQVTIRKTWLAIAGIGLIVAIGVGAYAAFWLWKNLGAELLLQNQEAKVTIPKPMAVGIDILDNLDIELDTVLSTTVPIDQRVTLPLRDTLSVDVAFNSTIPIQMNVPLKQKIPLDQTIPIDGEVEVKALGQWITLPIKGDLPVQAEVPVDVNVPVDQMVDLKFNAPAEVRIMEDLEVDLKTDLETDIPLKTALSVPVRSQMQAYATILEPADALIAELDLKLPIRDIGLSLTEGDAKSTAESEAEEAVEPEDEAGETEVARQGDES